MKKTSRTDRLTAVQKETLRAIVTMTRRNGLVPTERELATMLRVSQSAIRARLAALVRKQKIVRNPRIARGIIVV